MSTPLIAVVELRRNSETPTYGYQMISRESFKKIFEADQFLVTTLDKKERWINAKWKPEAKEGEVNSFFSTNKNPLPKVHVVPISVAEIWLKHEKRKTAKCTVFDPTGKYANDERCCIFHHEFFSSKFSLLNVWSGYAIPESKVHSYTNWELLRFFLNHIK